jgi:hypothetical protein
MIYWENQVIIKKSGDNMKKSTLLTLVLMALTLILSAQTQPITDWLVNIGGTGQWTSATHIAGDYIGGSFQKPMQWEGGAGVTIDKQSECWIGKIGKDGSPVWMRSFGGVSPDLLNNLDTDIDGNLYVTGTSYSADFIVDGMAFKNHRLRGATSDGFVAKFDKEGKCQWITSIGGTNNDEGQNIHVSNDGTVYACGSFVGEYSGLTKWGQAEALLTKIDNDGNIIWQRHAGSYGSDAFTAVTTNDSGQVFVGGNVGPYNKGYWYVGRLAVKTLSLNMTETVLISFSPDGELLWAQNMGGLSIDSCQDLISIGDDIIMTGMYQYTYATFGGFRFAQNGRSWDTYVVRIDPAGKGVWGMRYGGTKRDVSQHLVTDGNVIIVSIMADGWDTNGTSYGYATYLTLDPKSGAIMSTFRPVGKQTFAWGASITPGHITYVGTFQKEMGAGKSQIKARGIQDIYIYRKHLNVPILY